MVVLEVVLEVALEVLQLVALALAKAVGISQCKLNVINVYGCCLLTICLSKYCDFRYI